jgi:predicted  nucleic acid-binding Zn-ribbon protein
MMEQKPFAAFLDLITFDQKIHGFQKDILLLRHRLDELKAKEDDLTQKATNSQSLVDSLRVQVTLQEKEIQDLDAQEKAKKKIQGTLSDYREIKALQSEIDDLKRGQMELEQRVMQSWNKLDHAQKEVAKAQAAHTQQAKEVQDEIIVLEAEILKHTHHLNELLQERPAKVEHVPHEWMDHYTMMASRLPDPVVPVENESCSACFTSIAKQDMLRLQKRALLKCKMCFRLLYLPSAMERDNN